MTTIRIAITRMLIRIAMKTCVMGFCYDHLVEAIKWERDGDRSWSND